jgi:hypothetical protein
MRGAKEIKEYQRITKYINNQKPYSRNLLYYTNLPYQFLMLSKLFKIEPQYIITDFLQNSGLEAWPTIGGGSNELARQKAIEYIVACGYGQDFYTAEEIKQMMNELNFINSLNPKKASEKMKDLHWKWRNKYWKFWFKKWYYKIRRKELTSES